MLHLRPLDRLKFFLERQFVKGPHYQLLVMAGFVGLISLLGGLLAFGTGAPEDTVADSVWWAFLRLTDPGYLGDDEGAWRRIVSVVLTVSGYVVFMGALIAILTQWLISRMRALERGLTPVALKHHIVVLGWTSRTLPVLRELLLSEGRIKRLLADLGPGRRLRLVVLADELSPELTEELRTDMVTGRHLKHVILRSGSALNTEHLTRAACLHAAAIIIPARTFSHDNLISPDVETIKALLSLDGQAQTEGAALPYVVAEIQDPRKAGIARRAYRGRMEVVNGDSSISRLIVQNVRHPGLSNVYNELLSHDLGNNIYIRQDPGLTGRQVGELGPLFRTSVLCGVVRQRAGQYEAHLNPPPAFRIAASDALVLIAESYEQAALLDGQAATHPPMPEQSPAPSPLATGLPEQTSVLVLGWSRKVPALLREFATYGEDVFRITVVSTLPVAERLRTLADEGVVMPEGGCRHLEADFINESELRLVHPRQFDSIILMSSDRLGSGEEADARSIVGYLLLEALLEEQHARPDHQPDEQPGQQPRVLLELSDPHNERLMGQRQGEVIISPLLLSHILAQVALRQELRSVFDALFSAGGPEISFRPPAAYGLTQGGCTFEELRRLAWRHGETALGVYRHSPSRGTPGRLELNPRRGVDLALRTGDQLVVMMTG